MPNVCTTAAFIIRGIDFILRLSRTGRRWHRMTPQMGGALIQRKQGSVFKRWTKR
jgi:hypothetical protein